MDEADYLWNRRQQIKLQALVNRLYQQDRWRRFEMLEGCVKAASLLSGSVALLQVPAMQGATPWLGVIFVGTALSLVLGWGGKARDAAQRASDWVSVERELALLGERGLHETDLDRLAARVCEIEATEPAAHPGMLERANERACLALGTKPITKASWWQRNRPALAVP